MNANKLDSMIEKAWKDVEKVQTKMTLPIKYSKKEMNAFNSQLNNLMQVIKIYTELKGGC